MDAMTPSKTMQFISPLNLGEGIKSIMTREWMCYVQTPKVFCVNWNEKEGSCNSVILTVEGGKD